MILEEISAKLETLGLPVYYGHQHLGDGEPWNYIVFSRTTTSRSDSKHGKTKGFTVAVVHEDYVDDDLDDQIVELLSDIPSIRLGPGDVTYDYTSKPGTGVTVEVMVVPFVKAEKR